jgi:putative membrane protein
MEGFLWLEAKQSEAAMKRIVLAVISACLASSCAMPYGGPGIYGSCRVFTPYGGGMWIIFIIIIGILALYLFRTGRLGGGPSETPLDILKKRYAKGEISQEEFERVRKELE